MEEEAPLSSFAELMTEVFYDWRPGENQIRRNPDAPIWSMSKTSIYEKSGQAFLHYKTLIFKIPPAILEQWEVFYDLYQGDLEFQKVLDLIQTNWNVSMTRVAPEHYTWGAWVLMLKKQPYIQTTHQKIEISSAVAKKLNIFAQMMISTI